MGVSRMISFKNVDKNFGGIKALDNVSLDIKKGDILAYIGPNGAGKTTTIRLILGLIKPSSGEVRVFEKDPYTSLDVRKKIDFVLDHPGVDDDLTAWENLKFYNMVYGVNNDISEILKKVELSGVRDKLVGTFSGGMKQRLSIARLFLRTPQAIIMDEPMAGLDVDGRLLVRDLIKELALSEIPMLISSHDLFELQKTCNKAVIILDGKIVKMDSMENILKSQRPEYYITVSGEVSDKLLYLLESYGLVTYENEEKIIKVSLLSGTISDVVREITEAGVEIEDMEKKKRSLEDAYKTEIDDAQGNNLA